jgi:hypothetical protein
LTKGKQNQDIDLSGMEESDTDEELLPSQLLIGEGSHSGTQFPIEWRIRLMEGMKCIQSRNTG